MTTPALAASALALLSLPGEAATPPKYVICQGDVYTAEATVTSADAHDQHGRPRYIVAFRLPADFDTVDSRPTPETFSAFKPGDRAIVRYRLKMLEGNGRSHPIGTEFISAHPLAPASSEISPPAAASPPRVPAPHSPAPPSTAATRRAAR